MIHLILFWHSGDLRTSVRVIRGGRRKAILARTMVQRIYDDPNARIVEVQDDHDDFQDLKFDYDESLRSAYDQ